MKITKQYNWNRRDFTYDARCEHCEAISTNNSGYDDNNYYQNVVPDIKCKNCGESSNSKVSTEPKSVTVPRYSDNQIM